MNNRNVFQFIAISQKDSNIYAKNSIDSHDPYSLIMHNNSESKYLDLCQFSDGFIYVLMIDPLDHINKVFRTTNTISSMFLDNIIESVPSLYLDKNNLVSFFQYNTYNESGYVGIDINGAIYYRINSNTNQTGFLGLSVIQGHGMGESITNDVVIKRMDYFSDGSLVCIATDGRLYLKKNLSSYPIRAPNNDKILLDIAVVREYGDMMFAVTVTGMLVQRTLNGIHGFWNGTWTDPNTSSCCCDSLAIFS
jgi:hypothetical protein